MEKYNSQPQPKPLDEYTQNELVAARNNIEGRLNTLGDVAFKPAESDDLVQATVERLSNDFFAQSEEERQDDNELSYLSRHGRGALPDEMIDGLDELIATATEFKIISTRLDQKYGLDLAQYVSEEAKGLRDRLNKAHDTDTVSELKFLLEDVIVGLEQSGDSYEMAEFYFDSVERLRLRIDEEQFEDEEGVLSESDLMARWNVVGELAKAKILRQAYRRDPYGLPIEQAMKKADSLPGHDYLVSLDREQADALIDHLQSIDIEKQIDAVTISGLETLTFEYTADNVKDVLRLVPAISLDGVEQIVFRPRSSDEIAEDAHYDLWDGIGATLAHHIHDTPKNSAVITVFTDQFQNKDDQDLPYTKHRMEAALIHELGHALHYKLPVALLDVWHKVASEEQIAVTEYVKETNKHNEEYGFMEDFADTLKLYITAPHYLEKIAPARFVAMHLLFLTTKSAPERAKQDA